VSRGEKNNNLFPIGQCGKKSFVSVER